MWIWQRESWPDLSYDRKELVHLEEQFLENAGKHMGALKHVSSDEGDMLKVELLSEEALKTSRIEGELLDRDSLQSSIRRQFGLQTDHRKVPPAEQGIAAMTVNLYRTFDAPLTHEYLWDWHRILINGQQNIRIGAYRNDNYPMQVVSGAIHAPTVHFETPPASVLSKEMETFTLWFNATSRDGTSPLPALTRAAIAHLHFVCIHPFEDGNGRIARALAEKALAQNLGRPTLTSLAYTIERARKEYYARLERNNKDTEITDWIVYFARTVLDAQDNTLRRIEFVIEKAKIYDRLRERMNARQEKAIARMFREGIDGFKGGLSAKNYISITSAPRTTATRDLNDLVAKGALTKVGRLKNTRYHLNIAGKAHEGLAKGDWG